MFPLHFFSLRPGQLPQVLCACRTEIQGGVFMQLFRFFHWAQGSNQRRAGGDAPGALRQNFQHQIAVFQRRRPHADGQIQAFTHHIYPAISRFQMHRDLRVIGHKGRHHATDPGVQNGHRASHAHRATGFGAGLFDGLLCGIGFYQHGLAVRIVIQTDVGDGKPSRRALDQAYAQAFFQ
ncbi:hypothetical protein D3C71_1700750 [compost metagenome]